jgi:hypothetical protein
VERLVRPFTSDDDGDRYDGTLADHVDELISVDVSPNAPCP